MVLAPPNPLDSGGQLLPGGATPTGRQLRCCTASGCRAVGAEPLLQALRRAQASAAPAGQALRINSLTINSLAI